MSGDESKAGKSDKKKSWRGGFRGGRGGGKYRQFGNGGGGGFSISKGDPVAIGNQDNLWRHFLGVQDFHDTSVQLKVQIAKRYLTSSTKNKAKSLKSKSSLQSFIVDYKDLLRDPQITSEWGDLKAELKSNANKVLGIFGLAASDDEFIQRARLTGFNEYASLSELRATEVGKLVCIKGTVIKVANVTHTCSWLTFQCERCESLCSVEQKPRGHYTKPNKCPQEGCRSQTFTPQRSDPSTLTVNTQVIRIQEGRNNFGGGRVPKSIDCHLSNDLCDSVAPGDDINVTAIVKVMNDGGHSENSFNLFLEAASISQTKSSDKTQFEFSPTDYAMVQTTFSLGPEVFTLLVASLCPSIFGHELVKAGLVLALFGGSSKYVNDRAHVPIRGDPHVLVVGDPGLGKSQMLQSCYNVAPRSVFVTATGVSTTGLTATISKGPGNEIVLEAGALVLADQGCCCIDEFDKMTNQHAALLEAMEQQSVSLAKSGVLCSLSAQTAILAAANPVGGHYNKAKTVSENLRMNPALLSRFDLVFILIDKPDEEHDSELSDHIMNLYRGSHQSLGSSTQSVSSASKGPSLKRSLTVRSSDEIDKMPHELMRKYIAYARRYVKPKLSREAADEITRFYLHLRGNHHVSDATPVTTRQLESLRRLTEARAKVELREIATVEDARHVIEIMQSSMIDTLTDEVGELDFSRSLNGSGMSKTSKKKKFVAALEGIARSKQANTFSLDQLKRVALGIGLPMDNFSDVLSSLNHQGYIIKKSNGVYQLQSAGE